MKSEMPNRAIIFATASTLDRLRHVTLLYIIKLRLDTRILKKELENERWK